MMWTIIQAALVTFLLAVTGTESQQIPTAFTVAQNTNIHVANASIIPFNKIITWKHSGARSGGVFTCAQRGLYKFQVYSLTRSDNRLWLELFKNDELIVSLWGHTPTDYADAGNAAILDLNVGDRVYVQSRDNYDVNLYGEADQIYTTFTGVFLGHLLSDAVQGSQSAFTVVLNHPLNLTSGSAVKYNKVIVDQAYAFDVTSGVYSAPSDGVYIFHFFSNGRPNTEMWQELRNNNVYVCSIYNTQSTESSAGGNTVILHLAANDKVSVTARVSNYLLGAADEVYTSFSGVQISQTSSNGNSNGSLVAFSVGLGHNLTVSNNEAIKFGTVFLNLHGAYDLSTGMFRAPVSGVYEFNYHALGDADESIWLELFHNYIYVNSLYSHTPSNYATGGNAAVLQLDSGDVVHVNVRHGGTEKLFGRFDQVYTTFSGYLLAATSNSLDIVG